MATSTTLDDFKDQLSNIIYEYPEHLVSFAARSAIRTQFTLFDDDGSLSFQESPRRYWLAVVRGALYPWLWYSPYFPRDAATSIESQVNTVVNAAATFVPATAIDAVDAAYAACRTVCESDANFAASAAVEAAEIGSSIAEHDVLADAKAIMSGINIELSPLFYTDLADMFADYLIDLKKSGFGYYAIVFEHIARGGEAAQMIFNQAESIFEDTEEFFTALLKDDDAEIERMQTYPYLGADYKYSNSEHTEKTSHIQEINIAEEGIAVTRARITNVRSERTLFPPGTRVNTDSVSSHDFLNRGPLMNALRSWLLDKENSENINLGLFGEWGAGKSTFLSLLKNSMEGQAEDVQPIWGEFNAWRYEHSNNIQAGLAQEAVKALTQGLPLWQRIKLTFNFGWKTSRWKLLWFTFLVVLNFTASGLYFWLEDDEFSPENIVLFGIPVQVAILYFLFQYLQKILSHPFADKLKTYLRLPEYGPHLGTVPVMREQISLLTLLRLALPTASVANQYKQHRLYAGKADIPYKQNRLFFVVDDLDRCSPDCVVQTLEAVRLVMDQPNVVVIIAIDQRIALASLAKRYAELSEHHGMDAESIARDYLAKIIHIPIVLDRSSDIEIEGYLQDYLWKSNVEDVVDLGAAQFVSPVTPDTENPQAIVRPAPENVVTENKEDNPQVDPETTDDVTETDPNQPSTDNEPATDAQAAAVKAPEEKSLEEKDEEPKAAQEDIKPVTGLCKHQKDAFLKWVKRLEFTNPRQLKRLDNSYNLMRLRYDNEDQDLSCGRLLMLLWLEYLELQPTTLRNYFKNTMKETVAPVQDEVSADFEDSEPESSDSENQEPENSEHTLKDAPEMSVVTRDRWFAFKADLPEADLARLYYETRGFVLPAIEET